DEAIGAYKRTKVQAERTVDALVGQGLPAVIVNPWTPVGPRDVRPTPTGRMILNAAAGRVPGFVDTGLNLVHVDDVAAGHLAALERGRTGERYILRGAGGPAGPAPPRARPPRPGSPCLRWPNWPAGGRRVSRCRGAPWFRSPSRPS